MTLQELIIVSRLVLPTGQDLSFETIANAFAQCEVPYHSMEHLNWEEENHSRPSVRFAVAHTGETIYVKYDVEEPTIRAFYTQDTECRPFEDSCVEFFISLDPTREYYYNIESNCVGALQFKAGTCDRNSRVRFDDSVTAQIGRYTTLPAGVAIEAQEQSVAWSLILAIPVTLLGKEQGFDLSGSKASANFYKCGDLLPRPHYLSWKRVDVPKPDYHQPQFFGDIVFE